MMAASAAATTSNSEARPPQKVGRGILDSGTCRAADEPARGVEQARDIAAVHRTVSVVFHLVQPVGASRDLVRMVGSENS